MENIENNRLLDVIKGSLYGGAIGDSLGYAIEFMNENEIFGTYGKEGISNYKLRFGKAIVSDDTQMTLFTANGILVDYTKRALFGFDGELSDSILDAYHDWYKTQKASSRKYKKNDGDYNSKSWLCDVEDLFAARAPGMTCLSALETGKKYSIENKINNSKGCGGVMRVAPLGLVRYSGINMDLEGAKASALTHSHPLGYIPCATLVHIVNLIAFSNETRGLKDIIEESIDVTSKMFSSEKDIKYFTKLMNLAIELSENNLDDLTNIHKLGEGWVAEEALAIALYCALKYQDDFNKAIRVSVNHKGDSDSTGAITGNILGAYIGFDRIDSFWLERLELTDVIDEISNDLWKISVNSDSKFIDDKWRRKYIDMERVINPVFFWKTNEKYGFLSNWYQSSFEVDGVTYKDSEQYMMAQKALLFDDVDTYKKILNANTPEEYKKLGRQITPYVDEKWAAVRKDVCKRGVMAKFMQNEDIRTKILSTENRPIFEASPLDSIWGIGVDEATASKMNIDEFQGQNLLGKLLMEVRDEIRSLMDN